MLGIYQTITYQHFSYLFYFFLSLHVFTSFFSSSSFSKHVKQSVSGFGVDHLLLSNHLASDCSVFIVESCTHPLTLVLHIITFCCCFLWLLLRNIVFQYLLLLLYLFLSFILLKFGYKYWNVE